MESFVHQMLLYLSDIHLTVSFSFELLSLPCQICCDHVDVQVFLDITVHLFLLKTCATVTNICELPRQVGNCRARIKRYYYNAAVGECLPFFYGGCDGNENNFQSMRECRSQCQRKEITRSLQQAVTGNFIHFCSLRRADRLQCCAVSCAHMS